ncbi:MAG: nitroreductase family protein [bacterium]|nr:nitroreductase family protein [bacterium]
MIYDSPQTIEILKTRRSCRAFLDKPLEPAHRAELIEVLRNAPTSHNLQNASVILVEAPERKARLAELAGAQKHVAAAACNFIFLCDLYRFKRYADLSGQPYAPAERNYVTHTADAVILSHSVAVAALALGLGWVYIGGLYRRWDAVMEFLELPPCVAPAVMLCVGYPDPAARPPAWPVRLPEEGRVFSETYPNLADADITRIYQPFDEQFERDILGNPRRAATALEVGAENFAQYLLRRTDAPDGVPGELARQDEAVRRGLRRTRLLADANAAAERKEGEEIRGKRRT